MKHRTKILVTGATGFVGSYLISDLAANNKKQYIEIFGTCFPEKPEHCADLCATAPFVNLIHLDMRSEESVIDLIKNVCPDQIFHLAAVSHVRVSWDKRRETLETNLMGTFFLYEAVRKFAPKAKILFVSSSDVYGNLEPKAHHWAYREEDKDGIVSPYAFTKAAGELLSEFYAKRENLHIVIARPFPHTGPGQPADFVCSDWAKQIALIEKRKKSPIIEVGNLELRRDYSDVRDIVRAYDLLLQKGKPGNIYNICSGKAPSLEEILRTLLSFTACKIDIHADPNKIRKADIPYLAGSNKKISRETGWVPRLPLEITLRDLLEYWREKTK